MQREVPGEDLRRVERQAFAGMIWSKQRYWFDVRNWIEGDPEISRRRLGESLAGIMIGSISTRPKSFDAGQVGISLVRGLDLLFIPYR